MESVEKNGVGVDGTDSSERPVEVIEPEAGVREADKPSSDTAERNRLAKEKSELQELLQRRQAEFENYRRRVERERSEIFEYASMDAVKALLPIMDDLERA